MNIGEDPLLQPTVASGGINLAMLSKDILCTAERLLDIMDYPLDARILGKQIVREILHYVLAGPYGGALLVLVGRQTHFSLISHVLKHIESQHAENLNVNWLAARANISVSAFHHNLRSIASTLLLQYLETHRLHKAHILTIHGDMKTSTAAVRAGYEGPSQFDRKSECYFGITSGEDTA